MLAHWIVTGNPDVDVTGFNIDRLHPTRQIPSTAGSAPSNPSAWFTSAHYPAPSLRTARGASAPRSRSPGRAGAYFKEVSGWESPDWYGTTGPSPSPGPLTWGRPSWFARLAAGASGRAQNVILMDMSFMGKFLVQGRDAGRCLNRISGNQVDGARRA